MEFIKKVAKEVGGFALIELVFTVCVVVSIAGLILLVGLLVWGGSSMGIGLPVILTKDLAIPLSFGDSLLVASSIVTLLGIVFFLIALAWFLVGDWVHSFCSKIL